MTQHSKISRTIKKRNSRVLASFFGCCANKLPEVHSGLSSSQGTSEGPGLGRDVFVAEGRPGFEYVVYGTWATKANSYVQWTSEVPQDL